MKNLFGAALLAALSLAAPAAASDKSDVTAAIRKTMAMANSGDQSGFAGMLAKDSMVIDEFAPFHWNGFADWGASFARYNAANGVAASHTAILGFPIVKVAGDHAYAAARVRYTYREGGKPRVEPGTDLFVLDKLDGGWKVSGFAWFSKAGIDAGADADAVVATVTKELNGFNDGTVDMAKLPWIGMLDNFPPYRWQGPGAVAAWGAAFGASGETDVKLKLGAPEHLSVNGNDAYLVLPATIAMKVKGKPKVEKGLFAFTAAKVDGVWRTRSWAWAGD